MTTDEPLQPVRLLYTTDPDFARLYLAALRAEQASREKTSDSPSTAPTKD